MTCMIPYGCCMQSMHPTSQNTIEKSFKLAFRAMEILSGDSSIPRRVITHIRTWCPKHGPQLILTLKPSLKQYKSGSAVESLGVLPLLAGQRSAHLNSAFPDIGASNVRGLYWINAMDPLCFWGHGIPCFLCKDASFFPG